ncbi:hypothetical protein Hanom_Chr16g01440001 [Helianthus anomalus]
MKSQMKRIQARLSQYPDTSQILKNKYKIKQQVVNKYIDEVAELKCKMAELEQENNKFHSYHASSYILECMFNIKPDNNDSEKNKKDIGSEYHQVPPPFEKKFTFYDDEKVAKAFDMVDQLPDNIDVVESVLKEDSTKTDKSESQDENKESFHESYLNSKSEINSNDDPIILAYYMGGSENLYSDIEFPI